MSIDAELILDKKALRAYLDHIKANYPSELIPFYLPKPLKDGGLITLGKSLPFYEMNDFDPEIATYGLYQQVSKDILNAFESSHYPLIDEMWPDYVWQDLSIETDVEYKDAYLKRLSETTVAELTSLLSNKGLLLLPKISEDRMDEVHENYQDFLIDAASGEVSGGQDLFEIMPMEMDPITLEEDSLQVLEEALQASPEYKHLMDNFQGSGQTWENFKNQFQSSTEEDEILEGEFDHEDTEFSQNDLTELEKLFRDFAEGKIDDATFEKKYQDLTK